jgi:hypothetical protein
MATVSNTKKAKLSDEDRIKLARQAKRLAVSKGLDWNSLPADKKNELRKEVRAMERLLRAGAKAPAKKEAKA